MRVLISVAMLATTSRAANDSATEALKEIFINYNQCAVGEVESIIPLDTTKGSFYWDTNRIIINNTNGEIDRINTRCQSANMIYMKCQCQCAAGSDVFHQGVWVFNNLTKDSLFISVSGYIYNDPDFNKIKEIDDEPCIPLPSTLGKFGVPPSEAPTGVWDPPKNGPWSTHECATVSRIAWRSTQTNYVGPDTNSSPTDLKDDQKEELASTPHATPGGEATTQSPFKHPEFLDAQAKLNEFFAITTPIHEKKGPWYQERMFCAEGDCFLVWKKKDNGAWVEAGRFDQNNIDWDYYDSGIVTTADMGERGFKVFALKEGKKEYKFRCKTESWRNEFAEKLDDVIHKYRSIENAQTRSCLLSRPIKQLTQEIANRV